MTSSSHQTPPISPWCRAETVILCCGNLLFGDDGFGPAVARHLHEHYDLPDRVQVEDAGTGVREILFDISLSEEHYPRTLVVVDAVDRGCEPGELFEIALPDVPAEKLDDFSLHHAPTSNLLASIQDEKPDIELVILVCQVESIPDTMTDRLSAPVAQAVPRMAALIYERFIG